MKSYKGWSAEQRMESFRKTMKAIEDGVIPKAHTCNRCGQKEGIIQYHNEDYSDPIKYLEMLCWRCHMMHHSKKRNPEAVANYFREVAEGKQYKPVYKHNFDILKIDHNV
jgi:hypothetical protein